MTTLTPRTASHAGLSRSGLYRAASVGRYERVARGVYVAADSGPADWDWVEAASRRADATICLVSALAHHDLVDEIPAVLDVALRRGARIPVSNASISWHQFDAASFDLGREVVVVPGSDVMIGLYSPERSIADAFRLRNEVGYEVARDALREWLRRGGNPGDLLDVASRLPRAHGPVLRTLGALA